MLGKIIMDSNFIVSCLKSNIKPFQVKIYLFLVIFQSLAQTKISHMVLYGLRVISGFQRSQLWQKLHFSPTSIILLKELVQIRKFWIKKRESKELQISLSWKHWPPRLPILAKDWDMLKSMMFGRNSRFISPSTIQLFIKINNWSLAVTDQSLENPKEWKEFLMLDLHGYLRNMVKKSCHITQLLNLRTHPKTHLESHSELSTVTLSMLEKVQEFQTS